MNNEASKDKVFNINESVDELDDSFLDESNRDASHEDSTLQNILKMSSLKPTFQPLDLIEEEDELLETNLKNGGVIEANMSVNLSIDRDRNSILQLNEADDEKIKIERAK